MMLLKRIVAMVLLSCLVVFVVTGQSNREKSQTIFSVNKKPIMADEFIYLYRKNHQHKPEEFTRAKIEEYLTLFINYKLKVEEALYRGLDTTAAFKKEYNTYRDELLKPYLPGAKVVDSLVALTYERLKEEIRVSHILINVKPEASPEDTLEAYQKISDLRNRILAGENFGDIAAAYSDEPGADGTKGNLGYFTALQMVFPFEQAAYQTAVGEVSKPIRTRFGYHIIHVLDRQPSRGEVEVSHIMIRTGDGADNEKARNTIFDIYDKLQKGVDWQELCEQYSQDPNSKENGGRLRPFGVGTMAGVPEFEEMAFALENKGEISDPFQTQFGWHILRLESKIPLPSFEEIKPSLTNRVRRDERVQISRQALRERMKSELGYIENRDVKARLMALADSTLTKANWKPQVQKGAEEEILFTLQSQSFRVKDFLGYAAANQQANAMAPPQYLAQVFMNYIDAVQIQLMEEKIRKQSPDYKWLLKEYYEGILLFEIMEKEIWNKATQDTVGQRQYFDAHASAYKAKERIAGKIYASSSKSILEQLKRSFDSGDTSVQQFITRNKIRVETGPFEKDDRPVLSKINWTPGFHQGNNNGMNYLIWIEKILPPGPKTFQEARSSVISDYQTHLEDSWIKQLRKKFGVKVKKGGKKQAFEQLIRE
jgi:peptidyl-prolyl cis-trans isomerase SurA